jgi:hypothetical protein
MTRIRISCQSITAIKGSSNFGLVKERGRLIAAIDEILVFVLVFALVRPITKLNLKIKDFVADAINRGVVHPTDYIDMVQVGTEVQSGQGITSLTNYNIQ